MRVFLRLIVCIVLNMFLVWIILLVLNGLWIFIVIFVIRFFVMFWKVKLIVRLIIFVLVSKEVIVFLSFKKLRVINKFIYSIIIFVIDDIKFVICEDFNEWCNSFLSIELIRCVSNENIMVIIIVIIKFGIWFMMILI